jgi:hypothetical protein
LIAHCSRLPNCAKSSLFAYVLFHLLLIYRLFALFIPALQVLALIGLSSAACVECNELSTAYSFVWPGRSHHDASPPRFTIRGSLRSCPDSCPVVGRMRLTLTDFRPLLLPVAMRPSLASIPSCACSLLLIYRVVALFLFHNSKSRFGPFSASRVSRNELSRHKALSIHST